MDWIFIDCEIDQPDKCNLFYMLSSKLDYVTMYSYAEHGSW